MLTLPVKLAIVLPCYNEEETLPITLDSLHSNLSSWINDKTIHPDSFIAVIDDGSNDKTWQIVESYKAQFSDQLKGVKLSRNYGHQPALLSGLFTFKDQVDCVITIDADLQDDVSVMKDMLALYNNGFEIVYGVRKSRASDSFMKKNTAHLFYKLLHLMDIDVVFNHADYRLTSSKAINALEGFKEVNLFLRGIYPILGFKTANVFYDRKERVAGETKYPLGKMISFALHGITSFTISPLRWIFYAGLIIFCANMIMSAVFIYAFFHGSTVRGWTSTILSIYFIGSVQLMAMGIIGEYLCKVYQETKQRPRYIVEKEI